MIKRTITISNPSKLSSKLDQLIIEQDGKIAGKIPIEDIGVLLVEHPAVIYTQGCLSALLANNSAVIVCAPNHHPQGLLLPLDTNELQSERFRHQIEASQPVKKQLWKQTVQAKIKNQARLLDYLGKESGRLTSLAQKVQSGDSGNIEAQAARFYWPQVFGKAFRRERKGFPPNNLLNFGYMVVRAGVARALVSSGLLPTLGLHHKNRYNAFCLADDMLEPFRPFVDRVVVDIHKNHEDLSELTTQIKKQLLEVLTMDVVFDKTRSPLMVGLHRTTASLYRCLSGSQKKLEYPEL